MKTEVSSAPCAPPLSAEQVAWIESLIGRPWRLGAEGPDLYDCWSLTRLVQRRLFGRAVPRVVLPEGTSRRAIADLLASHPGRALWRRVARPVNGGPVEMCSVQMPLHVGTWLDLDGGLVLHCCEGPGVSLDSLIKLRALNWRGFRFYDWAGGPLARSRGRGPAGAGKDAGAPPAPRSGRKR